MTWPRDPAVEVPCPRYRAAAGQSCQRPSQHRAFGGERHAERDRAAMKAGVVSKCTPAASRNDSQLTVNAAHRGSLIPYPFLFP